jgi:sortase A
MQTMVSDRVRRFRRGEQILLAIGLALLAFWATARIYGSIASHAAVMRFHADTAPSPASTATEVDFTQWSPQRIAAYKDSLTTKTDLPLAILRIPKINLEVPVFDGTDDLTLTRGVGRIVGTPQIGELGNVGIAGHRDGFFRGLKDVARNDTVELVRTGHTDQYVITEIQIVDPEDVHVLEPTPLPTLTLVTCFPFYYVGSAPKRYVVTASMQISSESDLSAKTNSISTGKTIDKKEKTR